MKIEGRDLEISAESTLSPIKYPAWTSFAVSYQVSCTTEAILQRQENGT